MTSQEEEEERKEHRSTLPCIRSRRFTEQGKTEVEMQTVSASAPSSFSTQPSGWSLKSQTESYQVLPGACFKHSVALPWPFSGRRQTPRQGPRGAVRASSCLPVQARFVPCFPLLLMERHAGLLYDLHTRSALSDPRPLHMLVSAWKALPSAVRLGV